MVNLIEKFEKAQLESLTQGKDIPDFRPGDTINVAVKIVDGDSERIQNFEGLCIARENRSINSSFTVRKMKGDYGVDRKFPLYSPRVASIKVVKRGVVRRSKLYYIRNLSGKATRIEEASTR